MHNSQPSQVDPVRASTSEHDDPSSRAHLSANMTNRLKRLSQWRIDPSTIKFPKLDPKVEGGYAVVSRASLISEPGDTKDGFLESKAVAVKKMKVNTPDDLVRVLGLTIREAEFLVDLPHENIIKLEGFVEDVSKGMIWLVFPWAENGTLKDFVASAEWEIPERISLLHDVARGVEYLHTRKPPICHSDLKCLNILVNSKCRAIITDFGSAHLLTSKDSNRETERVQKDPQPAASPEATYSPSTHTITLTCNYYTLRWAAPELLEEDEASLASDIWAFGCVVYEVMTNSIPFQDVKDTVVIIRVVRGDLPPIASDARMVLIQALCTLVGQCWKIDPSKRPTAKGCREAIHWMPKIVPRTAGPSGSADRSAALLTQLGLMYRSQSDYPTALKYLTEASSLYNGLADSTEKANALVELAEIYKFQSKYTKASPLYSDALKVHTDLGNRHGRATALFGLAEVNRLQSNYSQAITFYSECLKLWTDAGNKRGRASALWGLADSHRQRNENSQALALYSESLQIRVDIGDNQGRADALLGLAEVHRVRGEYSQAIAFYSDCIQLRTDLGDRHGRAGALWALAEVYRTRNEYSQAVTSYSECLQVQTDIGDDQGRAFTLFSLAEVHRAQNEYSQAVKFYSQAIQLHAQIGNKKGKAIALFSLAELHRTRNECTQALAIFSDALEISTEIGNIMLKAFVLRSMSITECYQAKYSDAVHYCEQAAEAFKQMGDTGNETAALETAASLRRFLKRRHVP